MPGDARSPATEARLMILPPPCFSICGTTALHTRKTPFKLVSRILSTWPSSAVSSGPKWGLVAALLIATSTWPKVSTVCATSAVTSSVWPTWACRASASPPAASISSATICTFSNLRLLTTTFAPACASRSAIARPMPRDAPVTTATFPSSENSVICFSPPVARCRPGVSPVISLLPGRSVGRS